MTSQNYILLFNILLLALITAGCGPSSAEKYNDNRGKFLIETGEALLEGRNGDVLATLGENSTNSIFAEEAALTVQRMEHFREIDKYLKNNDFQALKRFLNEKISTGEAGPDMMELKDLPDALQALALFRTKMPWESPEALHQALEDLDVYRHVLDKSPAFRDFRSQQLDTLQQLKDSRKTAEMNDFLIVMEKAAAVINRKLYHETRLALFRKQPDCIFFTLEKEIRSGKLPQQEHKDIAAVILAAEWGNLPPQVKKQANALKSTEICGLLINVFTNAALSDYEAYFQRCLSLNLPIPGNLVKQYMDCLSAEPSGFGAWFWRSPCPGIPETVLRLQQFSTKSTKNTGKSE